MRANISVHEPKQTTDDESPLAYSMEGLNRDEDGALLPFVWSPGWNSNQSLHKFQSEVGGALRGGTAGVRLLGAGVKLVADKKSDETHATANSSSASPASGTGYLLVPRPQIFGSDELSMRSAGLDELVPDAYLEFSSADALALEVDAGQWVQAQGHAEPFTVRIDPMLSAGCIAYAPGLPQCLNFRPGQTLSVVRAARQPRRDGELIASDGVAG
jgi:NADH-quinone oxidoreductase subunit G